MKKTIFTSLILLLFITENFSQISSEEFIPIQKFIESTVQIPFMARVADVQGAVNIRITIGNDSLPMKYEIVNSLRPDCDSEAFRVVKLLNINILKQVLNGKKKLLIEVPFFNPEKIIYENGFVLNYYDKKQNPTDNEADIKFASRYSVDSTSGLIKSNIEYLELNKKKVSRNGLSFLKVDSTDRHFPTFLENQSEPAIKISYLVNTNSKYPNFYEARFENGQIATKTIGKKIYSYYPDGRIENLSEVLERPSETIYTDIHWFANGQAAYVRKTTTNKLGVKEKYVAVWDTLGKQIVKDGNGLNEYYEGRSEDFTIHVGQMKDGVKDGNWTGKDLKGNLKYEEFYENGICKNGKSFEGTQEYSYKNPNEPAEFKNGMSGFGKFLQGTLKYPSAAQRANVSGRVYVQFEVCTDGTLCNYKVLQSVGFGCDEESLRVLKLSSGQWKSGSLRGKPVKTKYTMPISYMLSR